MTARIVSVNVNDLKEFRKVPQAEGRLIDDFGLEGDRHAGRPLRQVSILDAEVLADLVSQGIPAVPGILGENLTVEGVDVISLGGGSTLHIGDAMLEIVGERPACREMNEIHPGVLKQMVGRAGKMARVVAGGSIKPGDAVRVVAVSAASA